MLMNCFNNRGFENEGFKNQGFENEGFKNRGFESEGFENRGFENEGFDVESFFGPPTTTYEDKFLWVCGLSWGGVKSILVYVYILM